MRRRGTSTRAGARRSVSFMKPSRAGVVALCSLLSCSSTAVAPPDSEALFRGGDVDGNPDPFGARAARQARAGRVRDPGMIVQPEDARGKVYAGDYVLANEHLVAYVEGARRSDGYSSFGGELLAIEPAGPDGRPRGISRYNETLILVSRQTLRPATVTVLNDGSDGKAAVVRAEGVLANVPFLDAFAGFFRSELGLRAALDYVLEPRSERLAIRLHLKNGTEDAVDLTREMFTGFFQTSRAQIFQPGPGYDDAKFNAAPWVGFDADGWAFVWRTPGQAQRRLIGVSGFEAFRLEGPTIAPGATATYEVADVVPSGAGLDGAQAALRRVDGDGSWRAISGRVAEADGPAGAGALVHVLRADGAYATRARADAAGAFTVHVPPDAASLVATMPGYAPTTALPLAGVSGESPVTVSLARSATLTVKARDAGSKEPLPIRVQVIPAKPVDLAPPSYGVLEELHGRLHQAFAMKGDVTLTVPPGEHEVIVSHGYEWDLVRRTVTAPGSVEVELPRTVESPGVMCADLHVHSFYSADSSDSVTRKVEQALADGLDIAVSSEHEWVVDFAPVIAGLGMQRWAFGMSSEELTTFTWGHFGVVPLTPRPGAPNNGAVDWVGKGPDEVFAAVKALPEKPLLIVNHPSGTGLGAYLAAARFDRARGTGDPAMWSERFDALEVFNDSDFAANAAGSVADWFALLDAGKTRWAVGSSDSHFLRTAPVGYPRTCIRLGHDDPTKLTAEAVRDALALGAATVSGGLMMTVTGPGGVGPGGTVALASETVRFEVEVSAPTWIDATVLEAWVDGEVRPATLAPVVSPTGHRYQATVDVTPNRSRAKHWVVFHARGERDLAPLHPGRRPFAVSNPVFF